MFKKDAKEAAPIMQRSLKALVAAVPSRGHQGADLRTACGVLRVKAETLIQADAAGPPLAECFDLARKAGITQAQLATVRTETASEKPVTLGAMMIKDSIIGICLATEARVIADMTFTSREDIDALKAQMNAIFAPVEEMLADEMDQMTFQAMVALHAAIIFFLIDTGRPLPRMLKFAFSRSMPTLVTAHRLYADAGRADQLRDENKVVHPAFMRPTGRALSA